MGGGGGGGDGESTNSDLEGHGVQAGLPQEEDPNI